MVSISQVVFGFDNYPEDIKNHWAKAAIVSLEENKIIDSLDNALYYPDNPITKNEFLSMLKKAAPGKHSQGVFGDEYINRDQAGKLLSYSIGYAKTEDSGRFKDHIQIEHEQAAVLGKNLGLISGYMDGTYKPQNLLTRAEAAIVLKRLLELKPLDKGFKVTKISGEAYDGNNNLLNEGQMIYPGETISTKDKGQVVITADDTTTIRIGPFSNVELKEKTDNLSKNESHTSIIIWAGKIFGRVQKLFNEKSTFEVHTPTGIAGIRGTTFAVDVSDNGATKVAVYTGKVAVANKEKQEEDIIVEHMEEISLTSSAEYLPAPEIIDLSRLDSWEKDTLEETLVEEAQVIGAGIERDPAEKQTVRLEKMLQKINDTINLQKEKLQENNKNANPNPNSTTNNGNDKNDSN